ncbi:MAG TPA: 50S ribosomal protein L10 [Victivallales bacterium]|nr:50S ribosomal protein L10 [Victivallales bacterium]
MRAEKKVMIEEIGKALTQSKYVIFVSYKGMTVKDFSDIRGELAKNSSKCRVFKNRLIRKAAELEGIKSLSELVLKEDTALITGEGDVGVVAKVLADFAKTNNKFNPKFGFLDGAVISAADVMEISKLPSKDILRAQLLGLLQAPSRNLASILYAKLSQVVNVLNNYKEEKEKNTK